MEDRIITGDEQEIDTWQYSLRPRKLVEYIGQDKVKENLDIFIKAALSRREALDHVLLYGPPGLGKTTLAAIIANELGVNLRITSGPAIERSGDLAALLTNLGENDLQIKSKQVIELAKKNFNVRVYSICKNEQK